MSGLWDKWHEYVNTGALGLAGFQILADWKKEADGLRRELETANQAVEKFKGQLKQAEEKIKSKQSMLDSLYANTERLWKWARETLAGETADQFWQISANGFLMHENPEYHQRINRLKYEVERLKTLSSPSQPSNRVAELEAQNAALREALEKALGQWAMYADAERAYDGIYLDESEDLEDMEAMIYRHCKQALSSPSQPPNRVVELEAQNAALREALENLRGRFKDESPLRRIMQNYDYSYNTAEGVTLLLKLREIADYALSPSQPSHYREMEAVVEAAKEFPLELVEEIVDWYKIEAQEEPAGKHTNDTLDNIYDAITTMTDVLAAYDQAGEGEK